VNIISQRQKRQSILNEYKKLIINLYLNDKIEDKTNYCMNKMFSVGIETRKELNKILSICRKKGESKFKVIKVEDFGDFQVLIQIPNGKKALNIRKKDLPDLGLENIDKDEIVCDYNVWFLSKNGQNEIKCILPTHDYMFKWYKTLNSKLTNQSLYLLIEKLVRERVNHNLIIDELSKKIENNNLICEIQKFLATLKWIILEEDVNYPLPRYMGSRYTLAAYALLEMGFDPQEIRRIIRF